MLQFVTSLSQGLNINTLCHYETVKTIAKYYFSYGNNSSRWLIHLKAWKFHLNKWIYLIHAMMKPWNLWEPTANQEKTTRGLFLLRFLTMRTTAVYASIIFFFFTMVVKVNGMSCICMCDSCWEGWGKSHVCLCTNKKQRIKQ